MNNKNMPYAKNIQSINFDNKTERKGKQNLEGFLDPLLWMNFQSCFVS